MTLSVPDEQVHSASNSSHVSVSAMVVASVVGFVVVPVENVDVGFIVVTSVVETTVESSSVKVLSVAGISVEENSVLLSVVVETTVEGSVVEHGCWSSIVHWHSSGS